ncbi:DUF721 domain-containing protein [Thalassomonas sp. M1454]|uniref:DUF721 domain-containing protein n=1 Tax=Thalassomonas sp. M1454 TaxID=2594477 RepID=UPI00117DF762|nr:DciA family protein [Thalassomonas sp. M1454]TRX52711.1 DUF721 domain-containing protein [Thalassomonas sp. M1454]
MKRIVKDPEDLNDLLKKASGNIADFSTKAKSLKILTDIVRQTCPDLPENAWQIANCRQDLVIIEAKSPVWGQRLQFERNNIAQQLAIQTQGIFNKIEIKVNPYGNRREVVKPVEKPKKFMSESTAEHLVDVAKDAPAGLKEVLLRLAKHADRGKS